MVVILLVIAYLYFQVAVFKVKRIKINAGLSDRFKIVQISDFHSNSFVNINRLKKSIDNFNPNIIVLTGDIISRNTSDLNVVSNLLNSLRGYKVLFVSGNHEIENKYIDFKKLLSNFGVEMSNNASYEYKFNDKTIKFFLEGYNCSNTDFEMKDYNILLVHNPNQFIRQRRNFDLVLSGHKHGGQVRLPFAGQIIDHGMKFFPKYSSGLYDIENSKLYIDSGLGQSIPLRALNRISYTQIEID